MKNISKRFGAGVMMLLALTVVGCLGGEEEENVVDGGTLPANIEGLNLSYHTGYVLPEHVLIGNVDVDTAGLSVTFLMKKGSPVTSECHETFEITQAQATELQDLIATVEYISQDPSPAVFATDMDHLKVEINEENLYEIKDASEDEAGDFIAVQQSCAFRILLKQWVNDSGLDTDCPAEVAEQLFYCENMPNGPNQK
jgi:hypothetical protein